MARYKTDCGCCYEDLHKTDFDNSVLGRHFCCGKDGCPKRRGFFGTVIGFVWYYEGVESLGPTKAGLFINLVPIFGIISARLILHERITFSLAVGAALVISGVYLTNRTSKVSAG